MNNNIADEIDGIVEREHNREADNSKERATAADRRACGAICHGNSLEMSYILCNAPKKERTKGNMRVAYSQSVEPS